MYEESMKLPRQFLIEHSDKIEEKADDVVDRLRRAKTTAENQETWRKSNVYFQRHGKHVKSFRPTWSTNNRMADDVISRGTKTNKLRINDKAAHITIDRLTSVHPGGGNDSTSERTTFTGSNKGRSKNKSRKDVTTTRTI